jgi:HlyD family secretion protein
MHPKSLLSGRVAVLVAIVLVAGAAGVMYARQAGHGQERAQNGRRLSSFTVSRRDFVRTVRLNGTVEAVESTTIAAPRLTGPNSNSLVVTKLVQPGSGVHAGDLIVEFDRQDQIKNALDRRAELQDLDQQIRKRDAQERAARAKDDGEISQAESALGRAQLEMAKNEMLPKIYAEKNALALEQAEATLKQLKATYELKRRAAAADIRILEIRRDRAGNAMRQAESNADRMAIRAPIGGMAVLKTIWKGNTMAEVQEGEEVRAGVPVVDIVNPKAMRVRARVNQADVNDLRLGQPVRIGLDAYPDLSFNGRIMQISPLGATSSLSPKVRTFIVLIDVDGAHPNLMPDLTASLDVELARVPHAIVVPRDAVHTDGDHAVVRVQRGSTFEDRAVTIAAVNAHEALVGSGLQEGAVIARNVSTQVGPAPGQK